jgi:hypothetical protein
MKLVRKIIGQGATPGGLSRTVSAYFTQEGPARGIWGDGMVVAHGGRNHPNIFFTGNMRSRLAVLATTVTSATAERPDILQYQGVARGVDSTQLAGPMSEELLSVRNGYRKIHNIAGEDDSGIKYAAGPTQTTISHVEGEATIGEQVEIQPVSLPAHIDRASCGGTLYVQNRTRYEVTTEIRPRERRLRDGRTIVEMARFSSGRSVVEPLVIDDGFVSGDVRDLSGPGDGKVVLCANAIAPANGYGWISTMANAPPEVVFRAPATVYLTGSEPIDVSEDAFESPYSGWTWFANTLRSYGMQTKWNLSLGAKLTTVDARGALIPNGVQVIATAPLNADQPPGMIWVKPGRFSGSIYAPDSFVFFRGRESQRPALRLDRPHLSEPIQLHTLVGREVLIELNNDHLVADPEAADGYRTGPGWKTSFLAWTN